jgi:hypothetical protein
MKKTRRPRGRRKIDPLSLSPRSQLARRSALTVLSLMRTKKKSLTAAIAEMRTTRATVMRYVSSALIKQQSGRYLARPSDRFVRELNFLTDKGKVPITVRSSRNASKIAEYMAAVDRYLKTGDTAGLEKFRGKSVRAGKSILPFLTEPKILDRLENGGQVAFEDLYAITT